MFGLVTASQIASPSTASYSLRLTKGFTYCGAINCTAGRMPTRDAFIFIHRDAPPKPAPGAPCNGCGVCCAALPCPVSRLLLGHRRGTCPALLWSATGRHYRCGMAIAPSNYLSWVPRRWSAFIGRCCTRWIAAGIGCDADIETQ